MLGLQFTSRSSRYYCPLRLPSIKYEPTIWFTKISAQTFGFPGVLEGNRMFHISIKIEGIFVRLMIKLKYFSNNIHLIYFNFFLCGYFSLYFLL